MSDEIELAKGYPTTSYVNDRDQKNIKALAELFKNRFEERFITPALDTERELRHGFAMMAIACLSIETFQSFVEGIDLYGESLKKKEIFRAGKYRLVFEWNHKVGSSKLVNNFFKENPSFGISNRNLRDEFYSYVRCGLLHGAETRGGWKIRRNGDHIFDRASKTINATKFLEEFRIVVNSYSERIKKSDWESVEVRNLIFRFNSIMERS